MQLLCLTSRLRRCLVITLYAGCALILAGCGNPGGSNVTQTDKGSMSIDSKQVLSIRPSGQPTATIDVDQQLRIGGKAVALDRDQQAAVNAFYDQALNIRAHSADMGQDGADIARGVLSSLAQGDISSVGKSVHSDIQQMLGRLKPLCEALGATYDAQTRLVSMVEVFRPYAVVEQQQVANCRQKIAARYDKQQARQARDQARDQTDKQPTQARAL